MNKHQVKGRIDQANGKVKIFVGKMIGNKKLKAKGKPQSTRGKVRAHLGHTRKRVKDSV